MTYGKQGRLWRGVQGIALVAFVATGLGAGCSAGEAPPEEVGVVDQAQLVNCRCLPTSLCGVDTACSTLPAKGQCALAVLTACEALGKRLDEPWTACNVDDGTGICGTRGHCAGGVCECPGCIQTVLDGKVSFPVCRLFDEQIALGICGAAGAACAPIDDGNTCTKDVCREGSVRGSGVLTHAPISGDECAIGTDAGKCVAGECCIGCVDANGACLNFPEQDFGACGSGVEDCRPCQADGNPCTVDRCSFGRCVFDPRDGAECDADGSWCSVDQCKGSQCERIDARCPANVTQCSQEICDPAVPACVAQSINEGDLCDDLQICTVARCESGSCVGDPIVCPEDGNPCTDEVCDASTNGTCASIDVPLTANRSCSYGCIEDGVCDGGECVSRDGSGVVCESLACNSVSCGNGGNCIYTPTPNVACAPSSICVVGATCDSSGNCVDSPQQIPCDDENPCTDDSCVPSAGGCVHTPREGIECADGDLCTTQDLCDANGECHGTPKVCEPLNDCRTNAACNPVNGGCSDVQRTDGTECTDDAGNSGACEGGFCVYTPPSTGGAGGAGGAAPTGGAAGSPATGGAVTTGGTGGVGQAGANPGTGGQSGAATGTGGSEQAGAPAVSGGTAGSGTASGGTASGGTPGAAGAIDPSLLYQRDPAGCSCRSAGAESRSGGIALLLAAVGLMGLRRRRGG